MRAVLSSVLSALALWLSGRAAASECRPPTLEAELQPAEIREFFASQGWSVLTFLGYSGSGYQDPSAMLRRAGEILMKRPRQTTVINIGATAEGVGAIYKEAKRLGFKTSGIVSTRAKQEQVAVSPCVDYLFYVNDPTWGGYLPGGTTLSPTSQAMVAASDEMIAIGGGDVARDELLAAKKLGKRVEYIPADMNHAAARAKAARKGQPEPRDFRGSLHEAWSRP